jgi:hypothetical protein
VKRFLKVLVLLVVSLFALMSGVDATLDHLTRSASQNSYTLYDDHGRVLFAYTGDLALCRVRIKPVPPTQPDFLHRTSGGATSSPAAVPRFNVGWL